MAINKTNKLQEKNWGQIVEHIRKERPLTTFEGSRICGVVHSTISKWVDEGKLNAFKTPGGHRRIRNQDLMIFLKLYDMSVPPQILAAQSDAGEGPQQENEGKILL